MKKFLLFLFIFVSPSFAFAASEDIVCFNGIFAGVKSGDVISWKGIPFAKPPVGDLRWKAPEAPDNSSSTSSADKFAYIPLQVPSAANPDSLKGRTSEDCLYLNVWKSTKSTSSSRPVVVCIYGGGYDSGATSNPYYDGSFFVEKNPDIIFVSVAYRVGIMGFIDFSQVSGGEAYKDSTNLGLLDILQALRWINENIHAFGGNKDNITLMGQSAGAGAISLLMTMPESKNLFKRAILESGSVSLSTRKKDGLKLAEKLLEVTKKTDMAGLMSLSTEELNSAMASVAGYLNFPILDGRILSEDIYKAFANNAGNFDMLIGTNADELRFWELSFLLAQYGENAYENLVTSSFALIQEGIGKYSSEDLALTKEFMSLTSNDYTEFFTELLFRTPAITQAESHTGKTFMYYWDYPVKASVLENFGAYHCAEIGYFLNNNLHPVVPVLDPELQEKINPAVANFIRTGNPSTASTTSVASTGSATSTATSGISTSAITWNEYDANNRQTLMISKAGEVTTENAPLENQRKIIMPLVKWGVSGREMIRGNLNDGISINENAATSKESDDGTSDGTTTLKSSGSGCNYGFSILTVLALAALKRTKAAKKSN